MNTQMNTGPESSTIFDSIQLMNLTISDSIQIMNQSLIFKRKYTESNTLIIVEICANVKPFTQTLLLLYNHNYVPDGVYLFSILEVVNLMES